VKEVGFEDVSVEGCVECVATFATRLNERSKDVADNGKNGEHEGHHEEELIMLWNFISSRAARQGLRRAKMSGGGCLLGEGRSDVMGLFPFYPKLHRPVNTEPRARYKYCTQLTMYSLIHEQSR